MSSNVVLITGAAGFIGSHLTERFIQEGKSVVAIDCFLEYLYSSDVKKRRWKFLNDLNSPLLKLIPFDLRKDDFRMLSEYNIGSVINLAALPGLINDWGKSTLYYECNLIGLGRLLEFCKENPVDSFIQASTSSVYGKLATGNETCTLTPTSPYGVSKLAAEHLSLSYREWFEVPVKILRYFSVYGPHQRPDMAFSRIIEAIRFNQYFQLYGDGKQRRANTYVQDVVEATLLAEKANIQGEILNICGDETITLNEAIRTIEILMDKKLFKNSSTERIGDQTDTSGSNEKAKDLLGWATRTSFSVGIKAQIEAQLQN